MKIRLKDPRDAAYTRGKLDALVEDLNMASECPAILEPYYRSGYLDGEEQFYRQEQIRNREIRLRRRLS
jgi:hypothetical protein